MIAMFLILQTINLKYVRWLYCSYDDDYIARWFTRRPPRKHMSYMTQGSSKACIVCPYVCLLTTFLRISTEFQIFFARG